MHRFDFFYRQFVTEAELDAAFDAVEEAIGAFVGDFGFQGVCFGADVAKDSPPSLDVIVGGPAIIYDQLHQRIAWAADQTVDVSLDENGADTKVNTVGYERWLTIFAKFVRVESNERIDGLGNIIKYDRAEGFELKVAMEDEYTLGTGTKPALRGDEILVADVRRTYGVSTILNAEIKHDRTELPYDLSGSPLLIRQKDLQSVLQDMVDEINSATAGIGTPSSASGGCLWVDAYAGAPEGPSDGTAVNPFHTIAEAFAYISTTGASGSRWTVFLSTGSHAMPATIPADRSIFLKGTDRNNPEGTQLNGAFSWTPAAADVLGIDDCRVTGIMTVAGTNQYQVYSRGTMWSANPDITNTSTDQFWHISGDTNPDGGALGRAPSFSGIGGTGVANIRLSLTGVRVVGSCECDDLFMRDCRVDYATMTIHNTSTIFGSFGDSFAVTGSGGSIGLTVDAMSNWGIDTFTSITKTLAHDETP